ncbi:MAG: hypothetical protein ABJE10_01705 [bacterium]
MTHKMFSLRFAALALGVSMVVSCDTRLPTQPGGLIDDVSRPTVRFSLSGGTNNTVDVGAAASISITASDNTGISTVMTTVRNGAQVLGADTLTLTPSQLTTTRTLTLPLVGLVNGDHVTIRTTVTDVGLNTKVDSLVIAIADTTGPVVTVNSSGASRALKGGDTLDVRLTASDSSGLKYVGYRLLLPRATDSLLIKTDSSFVPAGTTPRLFGPVAFKIVIPDSTPVGNYVITGFARDASGIANKLGTSVSFNVVDLQKPKLTFITPRLGGKVNVGDSLLVTAHITDNVGLKFVSFSGVSPRGIPALGTADTIARFVPVSAPNATGFPLGVRDTTITRYLKVATPIDTLTDSLIVVGIVSDQSANADTTRLKIRFVSGPSVTFISPIAGDSANRGAGLTVAVQATSTVGVASLGFRVQGDPSWPTKLDTTIVFTPSSPTRLLTASATIPIPADAIVKTLITITPISTDVNGEDGSSSPMTIAVRAGSPPAPRVTQAIAARVETSDSVTITALGNGITYVGFEMRDGTGTVIRRDSVALTSPFPSTAVVAIPLNLPSTAQGKRITIISFAYDQGGRLGYSLRAGVNIPQPNAANAFADTALVVYGKTYPLPANRNGTIADLQVDANSGHIFLSNINFGRLEVWEDANKSFASNGIVVGSQPWGMTLSRTAPAKDTLFVANSGGTNLSRVYIGGAAAGMHEDLTNRLVTRASYLFQLSEVRDPSTAQIRISSVIFKSFSDRPQYVEQSASGRLYISTKPTTQAPQGTIRFVDPGTGGATSAPDERFILDFASAGTDPNSFVIANADSVLVFHAPPNTTQSDVVSICDHPSGSNTTVDVCGTSSFGVRAAAQALLAALPTSDIELRQDIDINSLGLTDTTFVAASGDGKWITFGEGHKAPVARNFLLQDDGSVPNRYTYASGALNIIDLMNNQSDQVFGVALDKTGKTLGVHGTETAFSFVTTPFTQRLQGKKTTFATGSGIAFHPNADGVNTPQSDRLAFVASANGTIEAVDIAYYDFVRGSLATKLNLYGPLRATPRFPSDPPTVLFKLFGVSTKGLVVIDVTATDLLPGP